MHLPVGGFLKGTNLIMDMVCEQTLWNDEMILKRSGLNSAVSSEKCNTGETIERKCNRNMI